MPLEDGSAEVGPGTDVKVPLAHSLSIPAHRPEAEQPEHEPLSPGQGGSSSIV